MSSPATDSQYYQVARPHSIAERVVIVARNKIYTDFSRVCSPKPTDTILDVGVSDVVTDASNFLERLYPIPEQITAAGLGDGAAFRAAYPKVSYMQIQPGPLPFTDAAFDIASANAVLEHVGSIEAQRMFVSELARVAKRVFITVPHRYFPIEHHTAFPFVHYSDATFELACSLFKKQEWAKRENLILMSKRRLAAVVPSNTQYSIGYTGLHLGPFSSNLYLNIGPSSA